MAAFTAGDRVAWSHHYASPYGAGTVLKHDHLTSFHKKPDYDVQFGVIVGEADRNQWEVTLDDGRSLVLTSDELVRVEE